MYLTGTEKQFTRSITLIIEMFTDFGLSRSMATAKSRK